MCLFIGVSGLALAVYGAVRGRREHRRALIPLVVIMLVLALGANTPLFQLLYRWMPGFDQFRANAKFIMEASLVPGHAGGAGLDRLLHDSRATNGWPWACSSLASSSVRGIGTPVSSVVRRSPQIGGRARCSLSMPRKNLIYRMRPTRTRRS